ncbi:bifunctional metallophosphatase/5'-nucleotidase [Longispora fulva]|uniref:5'-nucleotidase n=1 Tax=Longispora fulva TaxID=619741 RepID=A0A8J7GLV0_9ACTN|nr:bifunctional metallophosphatase/5'-nucleotidase [Longispora fulva]MBG6139327.1 5'-nucleotidase [Longispora fulva]
MKRLLLATTAVALAAGMFAAQPATAGRPHDLADLQILAINDFHGNLEPPTGSSGVVTTLDASGATVKVPAGGVEYLATHLKNARVGNPNTTTVGAGDLIGASPLLSAAFHDEPSVNALGDLGLEATAVGNHEFDEGSAELLRMQGGGCHPTDGCADPAAPFQGAKFQYLAANVVDTAAQKTVLPPYWVKDFGNGAKVGFIGMTLRGTPDIVTKSGIAGLRFDDEVTTANHYVSELRLQGVMAIVVLLHEGGVPVSQVYNYDCNAGGNLGLSGPIVDIAKKLSPSIDLVITGHTHQSYACSIPDPMGRPRMVTSAGSYGREYTDVRLKFDIDKNDIVQVTAQNKIVTRDVPKDPTATALVTKYKTLIAPIANRKLGYIAGDVQKAVSSTVETPLGDLIADAQLAATSAPDKGGAQIALMNPGGIRADLTYAQSGSEGNGVVTYAEAFTVQPFNNYVDTVSLTGAQIVTVLGQQFTGTNSGVAKKVLQVSTGFTYTVTGLLTVSDVRLNGVPLDPAATYRVSINSFLADGGDGFPELAKHTNKLVGPLDIDTFAAYMAANSSAANPYPVPAATRITFQ